MKTFNLTLATIAIVAVASTSAFASAYGGGNGNQIVNSATTSLNDNAYVDQTVKPAAQLSNDDTLFLKLSTDKDTNRR